MHIIEHISVHLCGPDLCLEKKKLKIYNYIKINLYLHWKLKKLLSDQISMGFIWTHHGHLSDKFGELHKSCSPLPMILTSSCITLSRREPGELIATEAPKICVLAPLLTVLCTEIGVLISCLYVKQMMYHCTKLLQALLPLWISYDFTRKKVH